MKKIFLLSLITCLSAGCAIGPKYKLPDTTPPSSYRDLEAPGGKETLADLPWWELFKDTTLSGLIKESLNENYDLRIAAARIEESRALYKSTRGGILPQTDFVSGISRDRNSQETRPTLERMTTSYQAGFDSKWEVDVWGKIRRSIESAQADYLASQEARKGVILSLVAEMAQSYFELRELDLELEIAMRTQKSRQATFNLFDQRLQGGVASRLETAQAEADLAETTATIPELERLIHIQENRLAYLMGKNPDSIERGNALTEQYIPPALPAGIPSELLKRRPDLLVSENIVKSANAQVGATIGELLPRFDLIQFIGLESYDSGDFFDGNAYTWSLGGKVKQPLFRGGKLYYNVKAANARLSQARLDYQKTALLAFREVADALIEIQKLGLVRAAQEKQVKAYQEAAKIAKDRYEHGLSSYLEVLDSDRRLFASDTQLAKTLGRQLTAFVKLYKALGGGWEIPQK